MFLTHKMLMKLKNIVLTGIVLDYNKKFDSTLSTIINDEQRELNTNFHNLKLTWVAVATLTKNLLSSLC